MNNPLDTTALFLHRAGAIIRGSFDLVFLHSDSMLLKSFGKMVTAIPSGYKVKKL